MNADLKNGLAKLWSTAVKINSEIAETDSIHDDRNVASSVAWLLPGAELCAVYSIPMDKLEMFAVRIGNLVVGSAGVHHSSEYASEIRRQKIVLAPCRIRPARLTVLPSSTLTECLSRTPCLQELPMAA